MPLQRKKAVRKLRLLPSRATQAPVIPYLVFSSMDFPSFAKYAPEMVELKTEGFFFRPADAFRASPATSDPAFMLESCVALPPEPSPHAKDSRVADLKKPIVHPDGRGPLTSHPVAKSPRPRGIRTTSPPVELPSGSAASQDSVASATATIRAKHATREDFQALLATLPRKSMPAIVLRNLEDKLELVRRMTMRPALPRDSIIVAKERRKAEHFSLSGIEIPLCLTPGTTGSHSVTFVDNLDSVSQTRQDIYEDLEDAIIPDNYRGSMAEIGIAVEVPGVWGHFGDRSNGWNQAYHVMAH